MGAIRGAVCADNTVKDISAKAVELIAEIIAKNNLRVEDIDAVFFSVTADIDAYYPARAVRERYGMRNAAFMCFSEMKVENSLDHCIRACIFTSKIDQVDCKHCYLGRARQLREDL